MYQQYACAYMHVSGRDADFDSFSIDITSLHFAFM